MAWTAIGLGSNLGDRRDHLSRAVAQLSSLGTLVAVSALYETAPIGGPEQGLYLNAVAVLDTGRSPRQLLNGLLDIELSLGRERREKWGPRSIDLDLLIYEALDIDEPGLRVPHPRMLSRRFVLFPLLTVWPRPELPGHTSLAEAAAAVSGQGLSAVSRGYDLAAGDWRALESTSSS